MKITFRAQGGATQSTVLEVIDDNTILVGGTAYQVPSDQLVTDAQGPIQSGYRDPDGTLHLVVYGVYCPSDAAIWETPPYRGTAEEDWMPTGASITGLPLILTTGKTQDDLNAQTKSNTIATLKTQLSALDSIIPRSLEDLYTATNQTPYPTVQTTIDTKNNIRTQLKALAT